MVNPFMRNTPVLGNLRCRDCDIAIIINETAICSSNIGRVVRVRGPASILIKSQMPGWQIKPVHRRKLAIEDLDGTFTRELVNWDTRIVHEDAWLLPIRPETPAESLDESRARPVGRLASLPLRAKAGKLIAAECAFDFLQLDSGARFFDWEDMPVTTNADMTSATAWTPIPSPRNPSDVRNKAGEVTMEQFENLYFLKAYAWAHWPSPFVMRRLMEEEEQ